MDSFMGGDLDFSLLEAIGALVVVVDREGRVVWWNKACQEMTGYSLEEVRGERFQTKVLYAEELEGVRRTFDALAAGGPRSRFENSWRTRDGRRRRISWSHDVLREPDGQVRYVVGTGIDITECMQVREESTRLLSQVNWLQVIIDTAPIGVIVRLPSGGIFFNRRAEEIFGTHLVPELGSRQYLELLHHPDGTPLTREEQPFSRLMKSGESIEKEEFLVRRPDGSMALILKSATPIRDVEGRVTSGVAILEEITPLRETEAALREAIQDREHVLAIVSHDLRNPLSTITLTIAQLQRLLSTEAAGSRMEKALALLTSAAQRMGRLIDDLLDVTRLEAGRLSLRKGHHSVAGLIADALDVLRPMTSMTHHELRAELRADADLIEVDADRDRVVQIFSNLIGNAIKFTPEGGHITLSVEQKGDEVCFAVRDTGPGISREEQSRLFERFWQAERADRRGIGLGLSICKSIVEAHGGRIWAESQPGEGSTFYFTLPVVHLQTEHVAPR